MEEDFHVGLCPFCEQGWVDIVKDSGNNKFVLWCDECDTIWDDPNIGLDNSIKYEFTGSLERPLLKEIQAIGWDNFLIR